MKEKRSTEDYLKTIYILSQKEDVHGSTLARFFDVSRPTVCVALKALEQEGYVEMDEYRVVHLTELGMTVAKETYERHITLKELLISLGVDKEIASKDACGMEHSLSKESFEALKMLVNTKQLQGGKIL